MRSHRRSCALSVAVAAACFAAGVRAQAEAATPNAQSPLVARAIREWTAAFEQGRLGARAVLQAGDDRQPAYVAPARAAGYVTAGDATRITHGEALQKLMFHAERWPDAELGAALLGVAAIGLEGDLLGKARLVDGDAVRGEGRDDCGVAATELDHGAECSEIPAGNARLKRPRPHRAFIASFI